MKRNIFFAFVGCCVALEAFAIAPRMTRIVVALSGPEIAPDSFAALPKTFYLAARKYARVEEEPDPARGLHGLIITKEPDSWMINLADKTGQHILDPGPTFVMRSPIFWIARPKGETNPDDYFRFFEFGNELQFLRHRQAKNLGMRTVNDRSCQTLSLANGAREVVLYLNADGETPYQLDVMKDGKLSFSVHYLSYERNLPFDQTLFEPPHDVTIREAK